MGCDRGRFRLVKQEYAELTRPDDQGVVQQAACFQILQQAGDRLIDFSGIFGVLLE